MEGIRHLSEVKINELLKLAGNLRKEYVNNLKHTLRNVDMTKKKYEDVEDEVKKYVASLPRKLTEDEIEKCVTLLPQIPSVIDTVSISIRQELQKRLRSELEKIIITPLALESLTVDIVTYFQKSLIKAGFPVGLRAADIIGPLTQANLSAFHVSGSKRNVENFGIDRIMEVLNVSKTPKNNTAMIFFKDRKLNLNDVFLEKRKEFRAISISMLVKSDDRQEIYNVDSVDFPFWYDNYKILTQKKPKSKWFMRLNFDVDMLVAYEISLFELCKVIEDRTGVICISSPMSWSQMIDKKVIYEAFIDIYPEDNFASQKCIDRISIPPEKLEEVFLEVCVRQDILNIHIKGIQGIIQLYPFEIPIMSVVKEEKKIDDKIWNVIVDPIFSQLNGIYMSDIIRLCIDVGMKFIDMTESVLTIGTLTDESPKEYINKLIAEDRKKTKKEFEENNEKYGLDFYQEISEIQAMTSIVVATVTGTNLRALLSLDSVDTHITISNNIQEINEQFGIEGVRQFLFMELWKIMKYQDIDIHPFHLMLTADFMTFRGSPNGITHAGMSKQGFNTMASASIDRGYEILSDAASMGIDEETNDITSQIITGRRAQYIGTGYNKDFYNKELLEIYKAKKGINDQVIADEINNQFSTLDIDNDPLTSFMMSDDPIFGDKQLPHTLFKPTLNTTKTTRSPKSQLQPPSQLQPLSPPNPIIQQIADTVPISQCQIPIQGVRYDLSTLSTDGQSIPLTSFSTQNAANIPPLLSTAIAQSIPQLSQNRTKVPLKPLNLPPLSEALSNLPKSK